MGKKKRHTSVGSPAKWSYSQQISLLSWLDHTMQHDELNFNDTIVTYLKSDFAISQIESKLKLLWLNNGPYDGTDWRTDLFTCGSSCLQDGLCDDSKVAISTLVQSLEDTYLANQLLMPNRQLRSRDTIPNASDPGRATKARTGKSESVETPRSKKRKFQSESMTPSTLRKDSEIPEINATEMEGGYRRQDRKSKKKSQKLIKYHSSSNRKYRRSNSIQLDRKSTHIRQVSKTTITDSEDAVSETGKREESSDNQLQQHSVRVKKGQEICCVCGVEESVQQLQDCVQCDNCLVWQHTHCVEYSFGGPEPPKRYNCEKCDPVVHVKQVNVIGEGHILQSGAEEMFYDLDVNRSHSNDNPKSSGKEAPRSQMDLRLISAMNEIKGLQDQLKQMEKDMQEAVAFRDLQEKECWSLQEAQQKRDSEIGRPIEETIQRYITLRKKLKADMNNRDALNKFSRLLGNSREWFDNNIFQGGFEDVYSHSQQILCRNDGVRLPFLPALDRFGKLRQLVHGCLALDTEAEKTIGGSMITLSKLTPQAVVRGLTTCALRDWVFGKDFPRFDNGRSDLLVAYRNIISIQDGAISLRNLDLAATDSLIKSNHLQHEVIPEIAKALAILLSQTLEPLFTDSPGSTIDRDWDGFATWRDKLDEWHDRRDRLNTMFELALKVKANSCLNIETYEMIIYPPGTVFDGNSMRVETAEGMLDTVNDHEGRVVELCIQAAVFAYARQPIMNNDPVSEAVISPTNFIQHNLKDRMGLTPRVKAVVLLKNASGDVF